VIDGKRIVKFVLLIAVLGILVFYLSPLLDGIALGIVFAYVARPIMVRIPIKKRWISSIISTLIIVIPISLILVLSLYDLGLWAIEEWDEIYAEITETIALLPEPIGEFLRALPAGMGREILSADQASGAIMLILNFLLSILLCYYLLLEGDKVANFMKELLHIDDPDLIKNCDQTVSGIYIGSFYTSFIVVGLTVPFLVIFRIPHAPSILGLMFLAALIPVLAEWMILLIPLTHLALEGEPLEVMVAFIIAGAIFLYIIPELMIRPWLTGRRGRIHPLLMLFAFIGGGLAGGVGGFFLAPMFAGILMVLYRSWRAHESG
jgi:predicted PurR-regulated permease PerM